MPQQPAKRPRRKAPHPPSEPPLTPGFVGADSAQANAQQRAYNQAKKSQETMWDSNAPQLPTPAAIPPLATNSQLATVTQPATIPQPATATQAVAPSSSHPITRTSSRKRRRAASQEEEDVEGHAPAVHSAHLSLPPRPLAPLPAHRRQTVPSNAELYSGQQSPAIPATSLPPALPYHGPSAPPPAPHPNLQALHASLSGQEALEMVNTLPSSGLPVPHLLGVPVRAQGNGGSLQGFQVESSFPRAQTSARDEVVPSGQFESDDEVNWEHMCLDIVSGPEQISNPDEHGQVLTTEEAELAYYERNWNHPSDADDFGAPFEEASDYLSFCRRAASGSGVNTPSSESYYTDATLGSDVNTASSYHANAGSDSEFYTPGFQYASVTPDSEFDTLASIHHPANDEHNSVDDASLSVDDEYHAMNDLFPEDNLSNNLAQPMVNSAGMWNPQLAPFDGSHTLPPVGQAFLEDGVPGNHHGLANFDSLSMGNSAAGAPAHLHQPPVTYDNSPIPEGTLGNYHDLANFRSLSIRDTPGASPHLSQLPVIFDISPVAEGAYTGNLASAYDVSRNSDAQANSSGSLLFSPGFPFLQQQVGMPLVFPGIVTGTSNAASLDFSGFDFSGFDFFELYEY